MESSAAGLLPPGPPPLHSSPYDSDSPANPLSALASTPRTLMNVLKAFVGTGVLALPFAFKMAGLAFGLCGLLVFILLTLYTITETIAVRHDIADRHLDLHAADVTFGMMGEYTYGPWMKTLITTLVLCCQMGFTMGCMALCSTTFENLTGADFGVCLMTVVCVSVPLCCVRTQKYLFWESVTGNALLALAYAAILVVVSVLLAALVDHDGAESVTGRVVLLNWRGVPLYLGIAAYAVEGIICCVNTHAGMRHPERFGFVMNLSLLIIFVLYSLVGTLGYLCFGEDTRSMLLLNLDSNCVVCETVQWLVGFAALITIPVQFNPVSTLADVEFALDSDPRVWSYWTRLVLFRVAALAFLGFIILWIPGFDLLLSLVGGSFNTVVGYVIPPLLYLRQFGKRLSFFSRAFNVCVFIFGMGLTVWCTSVTLMEIVDRLAESPNPFGE
eukprot:gnl/Spiro4/18420_TR9861_c0_g1_i1.p1 gnl/Spiro4/18420_TR9861_c0_g1~~gnl/Spiro4/18420_TR9861_c0_g1_i1.p1  ORF type:complete len:443 (-),score=70.60 gnl/Spiro4/18420_TR9861_c0_g1_i1:52-1380(-)